MSAIRVLPPHLQREIAAGEVVTRPADAVKELLENALDAGATRIEIELLEGGVKLLGVSDDGAGIAESDLPLAPKRFATSKLETDLRGVSTLGFRGEALWSIAFASELSITSRPKSQLGGVRLTASGDELSLERLSCAVGTSIEMRDLFARFPARRNSLESAALETRRCLAVVQRYVLHHPGVAWRVTVDGELRLSHAPGGWREAVADVYGAMTANRLLDVSGDGISGVISRPELTRPRRDRMHLAVNGRPVELEDGLALAVLRAFDSLLPKNHAPTMVLNVQLAPELLNINVHPGKLRVSFLEPRTLETALGAAVVAALSSQPLVRSAPAPRVVNAPLRASSGFPELRLIGAYRDAYLVAEGDGDLWLVDQHAAHERVIFEELEQAFASGAALELPAPELVTLSGVEIAQFEARRDELESWGLRLEPFGGALYRVRAIPAALAGLPLQGLVQEIVTRSLSGSEARRDVLARFACHPAVRAGHRLSSLDANLLLEALRVCLTPWACPHGRPTALRLTERDLAHQFGRRSARDVARAGDEAPTAMLEPAS
jgi:DNA mismatch repair protein MutL